MAELDLSSDAPPRSMAVDLLGRLRNTSVPLSHAYLPVLEAVVNSIHAIEDRFGRTAVRRGSITVDLERDGQAGLSAFGGRPSLEGVRSITIRDNGIGFDERCFEAFLTSDTSAKVERGGKGVGRFSWLVVFRRAVVESRYVGPQGELRQRSFTFEAQAGGIFSHSDSEADGELEPYSSIRLEEPKKRYEEGLRRGADVVAEKIFEHCFNYFIMDQAPRIDVVDASHDANASVNERRSEILDDAVQNLEVLGHRLQVRSIHRKYGTGRKHMGHLCANNRVVTSFPLSSVSKLSGPIDAADGSRFMQELFVTGSALDNSVDASRTR
ncbi:MAG: ATP-binding protein, partial [Polyangiaceae bacterium]